MDDTAHAAAVAAVAPAIDPLADNDPNPAYLAALAGALDLADEAHVAELARAIANPKRADLVSALLCHELASCHRLMMRFGAMTDHYLSHTSPTVDAERRQLMARYQQGALALPKLRTDVDAVQKRIVVDWGSDDCDCRSKGGNGGDTGGGNQGPAAGGSTGAPPSTPPAGTPGSTGAPPRRGHLKNGNPSGNFLAAPRCGAETRAGCPCRQPAMKNGRCRLHGGKSTGARTADGQQRAQTARLIHGRRTAAVIAARSAAAAVSRRLAWMADLARELPAGHGVDRSNQRSTTEDAEITEREASPGTPSSARSANHPPLCLKRNWPSSRKSRFGCHPGESRGPYSRGLCSWTPTFVGVTSKGTQGRGRDSCPRGSTQSAETLW
jgi:hypothetical protein